MCHHNAFTYHHHNAHINIYKHISLFHKWRYEQLHLLRIETTLVAMDRYYISSYIDLHVPRHMISTAAVLE